VAQPTDKGSIWKKEITLGRQPKEQLTDEPQDTGHPVPPATAEPAGPMAKPDEKSSIWKKEITFRKQPREEQQETGVRVPPAPEEPAKQYDKSSIWKKEITFGRKPKEQPREAPQETGHRVPPAPAEPPKPDSVAELLRPLAGQPQVVLPPVTPLAAIPAASQVPLAPEIEVPLEPEIVREPLPPIEPEAEIPPAALAPPLTPPLAPPLTPPVTPGPGAVPLPPAPEVALPIEPELALPVEVEYPELEPTVVFPELEPAPARPKRGERKKAERAAERLAKEQKKEQGKEQQRREKHMAKEERRSASRQHKRVVGLKIGGSQIAAAQVLNKGGPRIVRLARMPLERGVVVGGELRESEELVAALKTLFRKHKLSRSNVRLGISNNRIGVRTFEISGIEDPKQLANAIRFRAQETLPIPLDEAVLDYRVLEDRVGEDGVRTRRVLLVVAHRELVDRYLKACRKAGLKLVGIDLEAFALLRALGGPDRPVASAEDAGLVCISIGHDRSTLAVSDGRVCEFTRVLAWGGSALDVALARVLDLTPSEAEPIKRQLSFDQKGEVAGLDERRAEIARRAVGTELQSFARELVASLRFYQEQPGSLGIGEILVTGGGAEFGGLAEELERLLGVTVRIADPLVRVKVPRKIRKRSDLSGSMAVAIGLGIED
jgi:type IV pilus assembly protein PilM